MPISDCEVRDPRTRRLLQNAFRRLLRSRSLEEISVQEITDAATVNRATFYDHYTDKFALIEAMVAGGFDTLLDERNVCFEGGCPSAVKAIVLAACDYLTELHSGGESCKRHSAFEPLMDAAITNAIRRILMEDAKEDRKVGASPLPAELIANAVSWAIYGAVKEWFAMPNHPPAEEIAGPTVQIVLPLILSSV